VIGALRQCDNYNRKLVQTCDYILLNVHYCMLVSSTVRVRIRVRISFSVWLVSCYAHVGLCALVSIVIVTQPVIGW